MEQVIKKLSTYSADWAGVCSALFELGGMIVIHDASGCNSTYTTFDEPRWYKMDSMFYISGLTEMDAVTGNDQKLIGDVVNAAMELKPKFIAVVGSPIPAMMGVDLPGIAELIEGKTKIPCFGFAVNGMNYYPKGASMAMEMLARHFCRAYGEEEKRRSKKPSINILGATPLDFSINGNIEAMKQAFEESGYPVNSVWAMQTTIEEIEETARAGVNVVVADSGIKAAGYLKEKFNMPYVVGVPVGNAAFVKLCELIETADRTKENQYLVSLPEEKAAGNHKKVLVIGEQVQSVSIAYCLSRDLGYWDTEILCPLKTKDLMFPDKEFQKNPIQFIAEENEIERRIRDYDMVAADPMYRAVLPEDKKIRLIEIPHEAFSSRLYRGRAPAFTKDDFLSYLREELQKGQTQAN